MDDATYRAEIVAAYDGEIGGEMIPLFLKDHLPVSEAQSAKLDLLGRLEARVAAALAPIVGRLGAMPAPRERLADRARARALAVGTWEELVTQLGTMLDPHIERFEALSAAARPGDEAALSLLVEHELALREFGRLELAGQEGSALACLERAVG